MKKIYALVFAASYLLAGGGNELRAQQQFGTLKGIIADASTGETVPFANVVVKKGNGELITGGTSNLDGEVKVDSIPPGKFTIEVSFMGYTTLTFNNFAIAAGQNDFVAMLEQSYEIIECIICCCFYYVEEPLMPDFDPIELASYKAENPDLADDGFILFPNPANDLLFYEFTTDIASLQLVDFNGCILTDKTVSAFEEGQLLVAQYPAGFYSLRFFQEGEWKTEKIVITH